VNTTLQGVTNGLCSLQEAIYSSEFKANIAVGSTNPDTFYTTGCEAGTAKGDRIALPGLAVFTFDHFWGGDSHNVYGPTATPVIFVPMTIEGNGATLQWMDRVGASPSNSRLFAVGKVNEPGFAVGTGDLALRNVYVKSFHVKGGNGVTTAVAAAWAQVARFLSMVFSLSKIAPSRTTERLAVTARVGVRLQEPTEEAGDCRAMAVTDVQPGRASVVAVAAAVRAVMAACQPVGVIIKLPVAEAERFFRAEMAVPAAASAGFAVAEMAGILGRTDSRQPVQAPAVGVVVMVLQVRVSAS